METPVVDPKHTYEEALKLYRELDDLSRLVYSNKLYYYTPIGEQRAFHAANGTDTRLVFGGNRSGKTTCGVAEAVAHALGYRPWLKVEDPNYIVRLADGSPIPTPNVGRVVAENYETNIVQTIWPKFEEWAPEGVIKEVRRNPRGIPTRLEFTNGSVIHFMSYEQGVRVFEGPSGHWFWCDEPPPQNIFNALKRGVVDFNGCCWITATPLTEPWMNDTLVEIANEPETGIKLFNYSIWDNCIDNGGTLSRAAIMSLLSKLPEEERITRETGRPLHLAGVVFPEWRPKPPFWVPARELPAEWPRICVIDPHPRKPVAVLWAAISPDDIVYIYRCLFDNRLRSIKEVADEIKRLERWVEWRGTARPGSDSENVVLRIIDTSANEPERTSGESVMERFALEGIICQEAYKRNKNAGMDAIHKALRIFNEWDEPGIVVFNTCREVKSNFMNFAWPRENTYRRNDPREQKQEPIKRNDDFIDCIRYIFQMRVSYKMLVGISRRYSKQYDWDDDDVGLSADKVLAGKPGKHAGYQRLKRNNRWSNYV